jgi:hypothetical protein
MDSPHALRSKGWAGLAFVVLIIVSVALGGAPPDANATAGTIQAYLTAHRHGLLIGGWLAFPTFAFFLWFVVGMGGYLRRMSTHDEGLPTYALVSGVYTTAVAFVASLLSTALAFSPAEVMDPRGLQFLWALNALANGAFLAMGLAVFVFACAHSMRRHNAGAQWVIWLGYLAAAGEALMSFGMFYPSGITTNNPAVGLVFGFALFALWMIGASITLIGQGSRQLAGSPA